MESTPIGPLPWHETACRTERGRGGRSGGGVSVRLTRFVLGLFVLEESDERLPRCLALQRGRQGGDGGESP